MSVRSANNHHVQAQNVQRIVSKSMVVTCVALQQSQALPEPQRFIHTEALLQKAFTLGILAGRLTSVLKPKDLDLLNDSTPAGRDWLEKMAQTWIIDGEWSQYHHLMAHQLGWGLTQRQGMWEIVSVNSEKFATDEDARAHVIAAEADPEHKEFTLAMLAINAAMVGNIRG